MKVINVVGARPNFMKIAPIIRQLKVLSQKTNDYPLKTIDYLLIHTGQHYDYEMSKVFFKDLELHEPDIYLGVGSGTHAEQTGKVMIEFERVLFKEKPDLVIVVGDVNSTLACALAASKIDYSKESGANSKVDAVKGEQISVSNLTNPKDSINAMNARGYRPLIAHVEAGLRSFDRTMPEEINRLFTDQISDFLFTPSPDANENLKKEGIPEEKIFLVGNVMVDSLLFNLEIPNYRCLALTPINVFPLRQFFQRNEPDKPDEPDNQIVVFAPTFLFSSRRHVRFMGRFVINNLSFRDDLLNTELVKIDRIW